MNPTPSLTLTLVDGARVVVPDSLNLITPYVLQEQEDWFEDEIRFLRQVLKPGQKVIDIGANYGVYTLSMARAVGAAGQVWAFEPATTTAAWLARSIEANGFAHVHADRRALSATAGTAHLSLNDNAELNELVRGDGRAGATEEVKLTTLDDCMAEYGWREIDFLKIDAEGEETNILKGGRAFFETMSPLVEYEVKAGNTLHLDLVKQFAELGYQSYRLVPGLQLLTPFKADEQPDPYLLNLFCCKPARARQLQEEGWLAQPGPDTDAIVRTVAQRPEYQWDQTVAKLPYGQLLLPHWQQTMTTSDGNVVSDVLALHALSQDRQQPPELRLRALEIGLDKMKALCARQATFMRAATLARLAASWGARASAVEALEFLINAVSRQNSLNPGEAFLPPIARYDATPPGQALGNWAVASLLEGLERLGAFSSFYSGNNSRERLEVLSRLGCASPEMERRLRLLRLRLG